MNQVTSNPHFKTGEKIVHRQTPYLSKLVLIPALALGSIVAVPVMAASAVVPQHAVETPWGVRGNAAKVTRTITIVATEIKFNMKLLTFKKNQTIRFVFVNNGEQPHEFMIANSAEQAEHRKMMSQMVGMNMAAVHHDVEGNVVDAKPGETRALVWKFSKKGRFEFACNYVGHAEAGMKGTINVLD